MALSCTRMPESCSGPNGRILSRQRFLSGRLACENVYAHGRVCNTIVVGLCKEYTMFGENVTISMRVTVTQKPVKVISFITTTHTERCKSQPIAIYIATRGALSRH